MFTEFDLSTVFLFGALVGFMLVGLMLFAYLRLATYPGFRPWLFSIACYSIGLVSYWVTSFRQLPYFFVVGNLCFVAAPSLALLGTAKYYGRRIGSWFVWPPIVVGFLASAFLTLGVEDRTLRIALLSVVIAITLAIHLRLIHSAQSKLAVGSAANCLTFFLVVYMGYLLIRVGYIVFGFELSNGPVANGVFQALTYAVTCLSNLGMVFGYLAMTVARTEMRLVESELRHRILVEMSPESVVVQREGLVVFANPAAVKMFGAASAKELIGTPFIDRIHPDFHQTVMARRKAILETGAGGPLAEMRYIRVDGTGFDVETQSAAIVYDGGRASQITSHDITELKQAAAERKDFERKLQETQKLESLGLLAGGIAHDFNNILTGILGNATLATMDLPASSPVIDNLKSIEDGSRRAAGLCRQLLAYSGKGHLVVQKLALNKLVEETAHLLKLSVSKKAELVFDFHPKLSLIEADPTQVGQVIMNLVINASDAIGEGNGVIRLRTGQVSVDRSNLEELGLLGSQDVADGEYVFLEVSDSGCGMSPETQARIFDPFFTTKFTGRGLGLSAVLGIVRSHKGALTVVSQLGRGTTFKLLFPCVPGSAGSVAPFQTALQTWRWHGCVLVVDDEASVRTTATSMLRKLGFDVALANDGLEGVELLRATPDRFEMVLMDLTMPKMDGKQAFGEMLAVRPGLRAVMMTGFDEQEASRHFSGMETVGFLHKPFGFEDLAKVIQRVLTAVPGKD